MALHETLISLLHRHFIQEVEYQLCQAAIPFTIWNHFRAESREIRIIPLGEIEHFTPSFQLVVLELGELSAEVKGVDHPAPVELDQIVGHPLDVLDVVSNEVVAYAEVGFSQTHEAIHHFVSMVGRENVGLPVEYPHHPNIRGQMDGIRFDVSNENFRQWLAQKIWLTEFNHFFRTMDESP
jgi:hypothetical protein